MIPKHEIDGARMMADLAAIAPFVKLSGTAEERRSLDIIRAAMDAAGFRTQVIEHDAWISLPGPARVVAGNTTLTAITHSMSLSSPPSGATAPLLDVGPLPGKAPLPPEAKGRILLVDGMATPAAAAVASQAGALGTLHISPHEHLHEMCISPVWGSPSTETAGSLPTTIACTVSLADGTALRERLKAGEALTVTLHAEVDTGWRKTPILVCDLDAPGADGNTPFVLLSGHHDTWYEGVMDNGSANIGMVETARICAAHRDAWRRSLRVCFWSGHSHGRYSSSSWYADEHWMELEARCAAHVNTDSLGGIGATVLSNAAAMPALKALAAEAVAAEGQPYAGKRKTRNSDESFGGIGIASMFGSISSQPPGGVKIRNELGWWWHTPHDRIDKVDRANLERDTRVLLHATWRLLADAVLPLDNAAHAADLLAALDPLVAPCAARGLRLDPVVAVAEAVRDAASGATSDHARMRASRALVAIDDGAGERFAHLPALPQPVWAVLEPLRGLAAAEPDSQAARLALVSARRARNRVLRALADAAAALA